MRTRDLKALALAASLMASPVFAGTPDGLVTSKTKLSLFTTAGIKSSAVHVDTNDGIVTLYGKVPSAEQKTVAERTARDVSGVRDVKNLLQVVRAADETGVARTDKEIMSKVEKELKAAATLKSSSISVKSVDKGVVLLSGDAKTLSDQLQAVTIADRVPGVRRVASEIKGPDVFGNDERVTFLNRPSNTAAKSEPKPTQTKSSGSDMRISAAVKMKLLTASQVPSTEISVDTDDGVVTLFGIVPSTEVSKAAVAEASKVSGVHRVQNNLEVVPSSQKKVVDAKDDDIYRDLSLAFKNRSELNDVKTAVKNGMVVLSGTVDSSWDEMTAMRAARTVNGVRGVDNQLKLKERSSEPASRL